MKSKVVGKYVVTSAGKRAPTRVAGGGMDKGGREIWHVTTDGRRITLVTSSTSVAAMDEAMVVYENALKRLARR